MDRNFLETKYIYIFLFENMVTKSTVYYIIIIQRDI